MNKNTYISACVQMVTTNALPFTFLDHKAYRMISDPIHKALDIKVNGHNILPIVDNTANAIRDIIKNEIKAKLICLKIDSATRYNRNVFGINLQYLSGSTIKVRTLGMIEMFESQTAEYLSKELNNILKEYEITANQIYSITTDNGANMLKTIRLLKSAMQVDELQPTNSEIDANTYNRNDELINMSGICSVRCAAHTLQLAVEDTLESFGNNQLAEVRKIIKKLKCIQFRSQFINKKRRIPFLDNSTRWMSSYNMVKCLFDQKADIIDIIQIDPNINISTEIWTFIDVFVNTFSPIHRATKMLQEQQLIIGDFYKLWLECELDVGEMDNIFSATLLASLKNKKKMLNSNDVFVAAIYMDPRFTFQGSDILSDTDCVRAKVKHATLLLIKKIKINNFYQFFLF